MVVLLFRAHPQASKEGRVVENPLKKKETVAWQTAANFTRARDCFVTLFGILCILD
jgi:hypothetical protein